MKIIIYVIFYTTLLISTKHDHIENIEAEVYKIKKFKKYQDAPVTNVPEFIAIGEVQLLGWSPDNRYLAYLLENGVAAYASDGVLANFIIYDVKNDKVSYSKEFYYECIECDEYPEVNDIYIQYKEKITKKLDKYAIKFSEKLYLSRNKNFKLKYTFRKTKPIGFGKFTSYLPTVNLFEMANNQEFFIKEISLNDGIYPRVLDGEILGITYSPNKRVFVIVITYVHINTGSRNSVDMKVVTYIPKRIHINNSTYKSLYSFCKSTGIKESEIRALNPWINKNATNIPPNAEIIIPNLSKEENNESK